MYLDISPLWGSMVRNSLNPGWGRTVTSWPSGPTPLSPIVRMPPGSSRALRRSNTAGEHKLTLSTINQQPSCRHCHQKIVMIAKLVYWTERELQQATQSTVLHCFYEIFGYSHLTFPLFLPREGAHQYLITYVGFICGSDCKASHEWIINE
jgi:hypothetical protein